ncbi:GPI-anchored small secreted protein [Panaeolus papilionaceus]|nr:GPI-anchored small secreted protein [Panaeolus papilionaceus]
MKFTGFIASLIFLASTASGARIPNADTPTFYLVSSSETPGSNLLPLRMNGGSGGYSTLLGSGPIGKFYFYQGQLTAVDPNGSTFTYRPNIGRVLGSTGCSTYGNLGFVQGSSSNKCAKYDGFQIQADPENSQLGSRLTVDFTGAFYSCGSGQDIVYKINPNDGPSGCNRIDLWTVPVSPVNP